MGNATMGIDVAFGVLEDSDARREAASIVVGGKFPAGAESSPRVSAFPETGAYTAGDMLISGAIASAISPVPRLA
jgi:hypothetical protein